MKPCVLTLLIAGALVAVDAREENAAQADLKRFEGSWSLVSLEVNAEPVAMDNLKQAKLTFTGERYSLKLDGGQLEMTIKVDPAKSPKALDLTLVEGPDKGKTYRAIYAFEKDSLKICRNIEPEKDRPAKFLTRKDSGLLLAVWKRDKP